MLDICPISLAEANAFVAEHHRHHKPVVGHKFSIGCTDGEKIVGVAIVGRPVSRYLDDGWTLEVNRCCTDGTRNACSMLYAAAWRAARAMGYHKLITYILDTESGTSLKAAGWKCVGQAGGLRWTGKRRPEVDLCPAQMKIRGKKRTGANMTRREGKRFAFLKRQSYVQTDGTLLRKNRFGFRASARPAGRRWMELPNERTAVCSWECERREVDAGLLFDMQKPGIQKELRLPVSVLEAQGRTVLRGRTGTDVLFRRGMQRL